MHSSEGEVRASFQSVALSRRQAVLHVGIGSVALTLLTQGRRSARAQEATPQPGLPPGVTLTPLIGIPIPATDMPAGPITLSLTRVTLEPGASIPESSAAYPEVGYTESGTLTCPGGEGRWVYGPDGSVTASGAGDLMVPAGSAIYVQPNALDGARNDGTDMVSILIIDLVPHEEMATPVATPA